MEEGDIKQQAVTSTVNIYLDLCFLLQNVPLCAGMPAWMRPGAQL